MKVTASALIASVVLVWTISAQGAERPELQLGFDAISHRDTANAVHIFKPYADRGDARALYGLGKTYLQLGGCEAPKANGCVSEGQPLMEKAAKLGDPDAEAFLGMWYENGGAGYPVDLSKAVQWYEASADAGTVSSMIQVARLLSTPHSAVFDIQKSISYFKKAGDKDFYWGYYVGEIYRKGILVPRDLKEAAAWYRKSADNDEAMAEFSLGDAYLNGAGVPQDYQLAFKWYLQAARHMRTEGYLGLAQIYHDGLGTDRDDTQALSYALQADEKGLTGGNSIWGTDDPRASKAAACRLASEIYIHGQGVAFDAKTARYYLHKAAEYGDKDAITLTLRDAAQGDSNARFVLSLLYSAGEFLPGDTAKSEALLSQAADQGDVDAMSFLGLAYVNGRGRARDLKLAFVWLRRAAHLATGQQQQMAEYLSMEVSRALSGADLEIATKLADDWRPLPETQGSQL